MTTFNIVFGILIILCAIFLIVAVLMQSSKNRALSGVISGGAETFFGKKKASSIEKTLNVLTIIVSIVFILLVLAVYIANPVMNAKDNKTKEDETEQVEDKKDTEEKKSEENTEKENTENKEENK